MRVGSNADLDGKAWPSPLLRSRGVSYVAPLKVAPGALCATSS